MAGCLRVGTVVVLAAAWVGATAAPAFAQIRVGTPVRLGQEDPTPGAAGASAIGSDGGAYLAVWVLEDVLYASRVDRHGRALDRPARDLGWYRRTTDRVLWTGARWLVPVEAAGWLGVLRLEADGTPVDDGVPIRVAPVPRFGGPLDGDCGGGRCVIAVGAEPGGEERGLYAFELDASGEVTEPRPPVLADQDVEHLRVALGDGGGIAVWRTWSPELRAVRLSADGTPLGGRVKIAATADSFRVAAGADGYLVVWSELQGGQLDVFGRRVGRDGSVGPKLPLATSTDDELDAGVAWRGDRWVVTTFRGERFRAQWVEAVSVTAHGTVGEAYRASSSYALLRAGGLACGVTSCASVFGANGTGYDTDIGRVALHDGSAASGEQALAWIPPPARGPTVATDGCEVGLAWLEAGEATVATQPVGAPLGEPLSGQTAYPGRSTSDSVLGLGMGPGGALLSFGRGTLFRPLGGDWSPVAPEPPPVEARIGVAGEAFTMVGLGYWFFSSPVVPLHAHVIRAGEVTESFEDLDAVATDASTLGGETFIAATTRDADVRLFRLDATGLHRHAELTLAEEWHTETAALGCGDAGCLVVQASPWISGELRAVMVELDGTVGEVFPVAIDGSGNALRVLPLGRRFLLTWVSAAYGSAPWLRAALVDPGSGVVGTVVDVAQATSATDPSSVALDETHALVTFERGGGGYVVPIATDESVAPAPRCAWRPDAGPMAAPMAGGGGGCDCDATSAGGGGIILPLLAALLLLLRGRRRWSVLTLATVAAGLAPGTVSAQLVIGDAVRVGGDELVGSEVAVPRISAGGDGYLAVWRTGSSALATRLDDTGAALDRPAVVISSGGSPAPQVVWSGSRWLVTGQEGTEVVMTRLEPDGTLLDSVPVHLAGDPTDYGTSFDFACDGGLCLLVLGRPTTVTAPGGVWIQRFDDRGAAIDAEPRAVSDESVRSVRMALGGAGAVLLWRIDGVAATRTLAVTRDGDPVGEPVSLRTHEVLRYIDGARVAAGPDGFLAVWGEGAAGEGDVVAAPIAADGTVGGTFLVAGTDRIELDARVSWRGDRFVVTYGILDEGSYERSVEARWVGTDGALGPVYGIAASAALDWDDACGPDVCATVLVRHVGDPPVARGQVVVHDGASATPVDGSFAWTYPTVTGVALGTDGCELWGAWWEQGVLRLGHAPLDGTAAEPLTSAPVPIEHGLPTAWPPVVAAGWGGVVVLSSAGGVWRAPGGEWSLVTGLEEGAGRWVVLPVGGDFLLAATGSWFWGNPSPALAAYSLSDGEASLLVAEPTVAATDAAALGEQLVLVASRIDGYAELRRVGVEGEERPAIPVLDAVGGAPSPLAGVGCAAAGCLVVRVDPTDDDGMHELVFVDRSWAVTGRRALALGPAGRVLRLAALDDDLLLAWTTVGYGQPAELRVARVDSEPSIVEGPISLGPVVGDALAVAQLDDAHVALAFERGGAGWVQTVGVAGAPPVVATCAEPGGDAGLDGDAGPAAPAGGGGCSCGTVPPPAGGVPPWLGLVLVASAWVARRRR